MVEVILYPGKIVLLLACAYTLDAVIQTSGFMESCRKIKQLTHEVLSQNIISHKIKVIRYDIKSIQILDAPIQHIASVNCQLWYSLSRSVSKKEKEIIRNLEP